MTTKKILSTLTISMLLAACGGGSSSSEKQNVTSPNTSSDSSQTSTNTSVTAQIQSVSQTILKGEYTELALYSPEHSVSDIQWTQTSGAPLTFLADKSKVIGFAAWEAGQYSFKVSYLDHAGHRQSLSTDITVEDQLTPVSIGLGHAILEGEMTMGRKSNLQPIVTEQETTLEAVSWKQTAGPSVELEVDQNHFMFFHPPSVEKDTILEFEFSATVNNEVIKDKAIMLIEDANEITSDLFEYSKRIAKVYPYHADSPYAQVLQPCTYSNQIKFDETCNLTQLPLIGQDTMTPTIDDIMDRVLVSHDWMGDRFRAFLEEYDHHGDFKNLLRAVTSIVISYDLNTSYYWPASGGAIHLQPWYFEKTFDEQLTRVKSPDIRSNYGKALKYQTPWTLLKDNQRVGGDMSLARLLYHELAHANDYFAPSEWSSLNVSKPISHEAYDHDPDSTHLDRDLPLFSDELKALGKVRQDGVPETEAQKAYTPSDITAFFVQDRANAFYNYASLREDYAVLFDHIMMKARYDVDVVVSVTDGDYIVDWGQIGRIGESDIKPRIAYVTKRILPEFVEVDTVLAELETPTSIPAGLTFMESIAQAASGELRLSRPTTMNRPIMMNEPIHSSEFTLNFKPTLN